MCSTLRLHLLSYDTLKVVFAPRNTGHACWDPYPARTVLHQVTQYASGFTFLSSVASQYVLDSQVAFAELRHTHGGIRSTQHRSCLLGPLSSTNRASSSDTVCVRLHILVERCIRVCARLSGCIC